MYEGFKPVERQQLIDDYCNGLSIPQITKKHNLRIQKYDDKWRRMTKADMESIWQIDFHLEKSKAINRHLMEQLKKSGEHF